MILPEGGLSKQSLLLSEVELQIGSEQPRATGSLATGSPLSSLRNEVIYPPIYTEAKRPARPKTQITYTFLPQTIPANSMILGPPGYLGESHPTYYITVNMNCFTPSSYITTIRTGGWEGELVGDFEMSTTSKKQGTMCLHGYEVPISEMLEPSKLFRGKSWLWKQITRVGLSTTEMYWEEASSGQSISQLLCFAGKEKLITNILATFLPSALPRRPGRPVAHARLEVTPNGHDCLDEIVMSALMVQRMRTS